VGTQQVTLQSHVKRVLVRAGEGDLWRLKACFMVGMWQGWFDGFVGCVERPQPFDCAQDMRETQHYDDGNTVIVALMKLTRPTDWRRTENCEKW